MTTKAVVLAAGRGGRLERRTDDRPKCLVPVGGRPLIHSVLESLSTAGLRDATLVLGHFGDQIESHIGNGSRFGIRVHYAWNANYDGGNATSLWSALPYVANEPFLLVMSDHLCEPDLLRTFLPCAAGRNAIAIDRSDLGPVRTAEATKVALAGGMVTGLGKTLERWEAIDTGFSHWRAGAFTAAASAPPEGELAALMTRVASSEGGLGACDVSGNFWLDVDTEDDLQLAERLLRVEKHLV